MSLTVPGASAPAATTAPEPGDSSEPAATPPSATRGGPARFLPGLLRRRTLLILLAIIISAGTVLRLLGVRWGLPVGLHPDEYVIVDGALDMARRHSFEPNVYFRPDHVEIQLSNLAYVAFSHLVRGVSPERLHDTDPWVLLLISRLITVGFGVGTMVLAYLIGARFNRPIGVIAAALVAFFPPLVLNASLATPDVPLTFAVMIVILGCMRYLARPSWWNLALACLGVSIGFAIKYPAALGTLIIAITVVTSAVAQRRWWRILTHGAGAVGMVVGFLFVISPVLFTNAPAVVANLVGEAGDQHLGAIVLGYWGNLGYYAGQFVTAGSWLLVLFFGLGVYYCIRLRLRESVPLMAGAIIWVLLSTVPLHWPRWGLPMYLTPLLVAPIGIFYGTRDLLARTRSVAAAWAALAVVGVVALNLVSGSVAVTAGLLAPDTRVSSAPVLSAKDITASNTYYESYTTFGPRVVPGCVARHFFLVDGRLMAGGNGSADYVMVSSFMYDRFFADRKYANYQRFYRLLDEQYPLVATFSPAALPAPTVFATLGVVRSVSQVAALAGGGTTGPTIKVYAIPRAGRLPANTATEHLTPVTRC